jgi:hypothetical protein
MAHADPFDVASPDGIGQRVQGIADQSEYVLDPDRFEHADQSIRNGL